MRSHVIDSAADPLFEIGHASDVRRFSLFAELEIFLCSPRYGENPVARTGLS
jgi:hypothetical protein